jgi:hypothetical protein
MKDTETTKSENENSIEYHFKKGFLPEWSVSEEALRRLLSFLYPYKCEHDLIRLGGLNDGGYLIPDDLLNIAACFSPGVDDRADFENELMRKFKIPSHLTDYTSKLSAKELNVETITKKYLGATDDKQHITLQSWMDHLIPNINDYSSDLLLQMDIEGNEYQVILALPPNYLRKFRIICIEIHWLINWAKGSFYKIADAFMKKLTKDFYVVHTHLNNGGFMANINGIQVPMVVEITLLRKDRASQIEPNFGLPHALDMPNTKDRPELSIPDWLTSPPRIIDKYFDVNSIKQF